MSNRDDAIAILHSALQAKIGYRVSCTDANRAKALFERLLPEDSAFAELRIERSRTDPLHEVWILKNV